jgi:large subunit ribosomal protein L19
MSNSSPFIEKIENTYKRSDLPEFRPGDTIRVHAKISEGGKDRIQVFQGVCIHRKRNGARGAFTVRKISHGVGVERVWAVNSPRVVKIELVSAAGPQGQALLPAHLSGNAARIRARLGGYASDVCSPVPAPATASRPAPPSPEA